MKEAVKVIGGMCIFGVVICALTAIWIGDPPVLEKTFCSFVFIGILCYIITNLIQKINYE